jgi:transposase
MRGLSKIVSTTIAVEIGKFSRFSHPSQLMAYSGATPSESQLLCGDASVSTHVPSPRQLPTDHDHVAV